MGPAARYEQTEAISLAFVIALQVLPARQRAVLILRDVLGSCAHEVADMLDSSVESVNSALKRPSTSPRPAANHRRSGCSRQSRPSYWSGWRRMRRSPRRARGAEGPRSRGPGAVHLPQHLRAAHCHHPEVPSVPVPHPGACHRRALPSSRRAVAAMSAGKGVVLLGPVEREDDDPVVRWFGQCDHGALLVVRSCGSFARSGPAAGRVSPATPSRRSPQRRRVAARR